jgi:type IV secretory pathway TraG/TraD family ATPase VirD4
MNQIGFLTLTSTSQFYKYEKLILPCDFTHHLILGETGSGKTTGVINPNLEERIKKGHGIVVFDFKGHYHKSVKYLANKHNRLNDVIMIGEIWGKKINILNNLNKKHFKVFIASLMGHDKKSIYWEESGKNLAYGIYMILKALIKDGKIFEKFNFKLISKYTSSKNNIKSLLKRAKYFEPKMKNEIYKMLLNEGIELIEKVVSEEILEDNSTTTFDNILTGLNAPLGGIFSNSYFNGEDIDLLEELNKGKIIVIKMNEFDDQEISGFSFAFFQNIQRRLSLNTLKPISVFIDEAQRVLSYKLDLPIDILREGKIDVVLATQSIDNLHEKLGIEKTNALLANLTNKIYLKGIDMPELKKQEFYLSKENRYGKMKMMYLPKNELEEVEEKYQRLVKADKIIKIDLPQNSYFIKDDFLDDDEIIVYNYKTGQRSIAKLGEKKAEEKFDDFKDKSIRIF